MSEPSRFVPTADSDDPTALVARAVERARARPDDVASLIEAAYACDRWGTEEQAIEFYDAAWRCSVPGADRRRFMLGYGSTLRNVGRHDEAVVVLGEATAAFADYAPLKAFLGLALHSAGHHKAAVATLVQLCLDLAENGPQLDGYERALSEYQAALLSEAMAP